MLSRRFILFGFLLIMTRAFAQAPDLNQLKSNREKVKTWSSGLGLQIARDLTAAIQAKIFYRQQDNGHLTAVISWKK